MNQHLPYSLLMPKKKEKRAGGPNRFQHPEKFLDKKIYYFIFLYMSKYKNSQLEEFAEIFKALSNPNRLKIFKRLTSCCEPGTVCVIDGGGTAYVGELGNEVDIAPSTVSHHIKELKRAGLIRTRRQGQKIECWVDPQTIQSIKDFL